MIIRNSIRLFKYSTVRLNAIVFLVLATWVGQAVANSFSVSQAQAETSARIIQPITILSEQGIDFGSFTAVQGGSITIHYGGVRTSGDVELLINSTRPARLAVSGEEGFSYTINLPATASLNSGTEIMQLTHIHVLDGVLTRTITQGSNLIGIGATLQVGASQVPGIYSGSFSVNVVYD